MHACVQHDLDECVCVRVTSEHSVCVILLLFFVVTRDTMIAQMKRTIAEQKDTIEELRQQKMKYMVQLYDANKKMADLENKLVFQLCVPKRCVLHICMFGRKAILQLNVAEKDSLIQTLQQSYAEVDDDLWAANGEEMSPTLKTLSSSPTVVQSPDSPKHSSYHELHSSNGTLVGDINDGGTKLMSSGSTSYSPTGKMKFSGLNLAVATSINDFSPSGQSKHYSSSVPSSPSVTHRLLHTSGHPSKKDNFTKSQSAELAWMFSSSPRELGDHKLSKSSSGSITHGNKNYSRSRKILKSFSTGRNSPLAGRCACMCAYICVCTHTCTMMCLCACIYVHVCTYQCTCKYVCEVCMLMILLLIP